MTTPEDPGQGQPDDQTHAEGESGEGVHDMGGDIGATPSGSRGGGGLGPAAVREEQELNARLDRQDDASAP